MDAPCATGYLRLNGRWERMEKLLKGLTHLFQEH